MKSHLAVLMFVAYAALIAYLSLTPTGAINVGDHDKSAHFLSYTVFALLGWRLALPARGFVILCGLIVLYSALMEFGQSFVPNREMSALDLLANALGVGVGYVVSRWLGRRMEGRARG